MPDFMILLLLLGRQEPIPYELTQVHQDSGTVLSSDYNISALKPPRGNEPYGNPNKEFPWRVTAGLEFTRPGSVRVLKSRSMSADVDYWLRPVSNLSRTYPVMDWAFPIGTMFREDLQISDSAGKWHTFEVRTRTKNEWGQWMPSVMRPYADAEDLRQMVGFTQRDWYADVQWFRIKNRHPLAIVDTTAVYHALPDLPELTVLRVLESPMKPVNGAYITRGGYKGYAPTRNRMGFSVVPQDYSAAFSKPSAKSCNQCHNTTLLHADAIQPRRDWYGHVRGADSVFSYHEFAEEVVSYDGFGRGLRIRRRLR